jgi:kumamolisin
LEAPVPVHPSDHYVPLADSDRVPRAGATALGPANPAERLSVTVYVRRDPKSKLTDDLVASALVPPADRPRVDRAAVARSTAAAPSDIAAVTKFARASGLEVVSSDANARSVQLAGTVAQLSAAFRVSLARYGYRDTQDRARTYRGRVGAVYIPRTLEGIVTAVLGMDNRPVGETLLARRYPKAPLTAATDPTKRYPGTFFPTTLGTLYDYPPGTDGTGECIAVLAFNGQTPPGTPSGGYQIDALRAYFTELELPMPSIENVVVHGPGNEPGEDITAEPHSMDTTGEIMLDLCTVGALAPGAKIVVYFSVFTEQGWAGVMSAIANDTTHKPSVISCSYGNPEDAAGTVWTRGAITATDAAFADAVRAQVTILCASGDDGSRDQAGDFRAHADFPASSPHVLGVGGTRLTATGSTIISETVWDDGPGSRTGGGVSRLFPVPSWQAGAGVPVNVNPPHNPGRGVPDVAAVGDPRTGVLIISVDGKTIYPVGGTSAAAPQWAALTARLNQALDAPVGFLNPILYTRLATGVLHDITQGDNGAYAAGPGWDACTGLGSPDGAALLKGLQEP